MLLQPFGYLVSALRDKGVEAYGIDVCEYAINQVREDCKPYCRVCSALLEELPKEFPNTYDLVSTIEVIGHLYSDDWDKFIKDICELSDNIVFSSSSDDDNEETDFDV